jgi:hypothetical protein
MTEKIFAKGIRIDTANGKGGEWGWLTMGIYLPDFEPFAQEHKKRSGWVNFTIKKSLKTGEPYIELDTWEPTQKPIEKEEITADECPF